MTTQSPVVVVPGQPSADPIINTLEYFSALSYDHITYGGTKADLTSYYQFQTALQSLAAAGWTEILTLQDGILPESYQGIAFYNAKQNIVAIANRGSQTAYNFLVSDAAVAVGNDPERPPPVSI